MSGVVEDISLCSIVGLRKESRPRSTSGGGASFRRPNPFGWRFRDINRLGTFGSPKKSRKGGLGGKGGEVKCNWGDFGSGR